MFQVIRERYNLNLDAKISDISPLANLTNLGILLLINNQISDISPLVDDTRLGRLYEVRLENNNIDLGEDSEDMENIMILEGREVTVQYE